MRRFLILCLAGWLMAGVAGAQPQASHLWQCPPGGGRFAPVALRAAKLAMIRARKPPVFWAAFILIGE
jgi:hypothetical protein